MGLNKRFEGIGGTEQVDTTDGVIGGEGNLLFVGNVQSRSSTYSTTSTSYTNLWGGFDDEVQFPNWTDGWDSVGEFDNLSPEVYISVYAQFRNDTSGETAYLRARDDINDDTSLEIKFTAQADNGTYYSTASEPVEIRNPFGEKPITFLLEGKVSGGQLDVINTPGIAVFREVL